MLRSKYIGSYFVTHKILIALICLVLLMEYSCSPFSQYEKCLINDHRVFGFQIILVYGFLIDTLSSKFTILNSSRIPLIISGGC